MARSALVKCDCEHEFQDEHYGEGLRLASVSEGMREDPKGRCTVCRTEKNIHSWSTLTQAQREKDEERKKKRKGDGPKIEVELGQRLMDKEEEE